MGGDCKVIGTERSRHEPLVHGRFGTADERPMDPFLDALPPLRARHLVVVGSVQDPEVAFLATDRPADAEAAYLTAAASESLAARERTAERLRKMGVPVEDRLPGEFAAAIADRYLDIKSAGRL